MSFCRRRGFGTAVAVAVGGGGCCCRGGFVAVAVGWGVFVLVGAGTGVLVCVAAGCCCGGFVAVAAGKGVCVLVAFGAGLLVAVGVGVSVSMGVCDNPLTWNAWVAVYEYPPAAMSVTVNVYVPAGQSASMSPGSVSLPSTAP